MLVGITSAVLSPLVAPDVQPLYVFPFILLVSTVGCVAGSLLTKPIDEETLKNFYRNVRPWGFWQPVHALVARDDQSFEPNRNAPRDLSNCAVGIVWQLTLITIPLYIVFRDWRRTLISLAIFAVTTMFLKKFWYDRLQATAS